MSENDFFELKWREGKSNKADFLTKPLGGSALESAMDLIGMVKDHPAHDQNKKAEKTTACEAA